MNINSLKQSLEIAGTLGDTSKMPGNCYGLPAAEGKFVERICKDRGWQVPPQFGCTIGQILARIKGSTCEICYANERANYGYPSVQIAQTKRVVGIHNPEWVDAMVYLLKHTLDKQFKQALTEQIDFFFCNEHRSPNANEMKELEDKANFECAYFRWHDSGDILGIWHLNKIYDVVEQTPFLKHWLPTRETSMVLKNNRSVPDNLLIRHSAHMINGPLPKRVKNMSGVTTNGDYTCHAPDNANECGDCRKCWDKKVELVVYPSH